MTARVTVVTRTRNRPGLLARAVASVREQTLRDVELVIVNDAGDPAAVDAVLADQPLWFRDRVTVMTNEVSHGREAALESGLEVSSHEFFAIHDDDDSWAPQFLERCVAHLDAHPGEGAVATRCDVVYEHMEGEEAVEDRREVLATHLESWSLIDTLVVNYVPPISQLIRREVADRIGHWDGSLQTQADWDFNLRLLAASPVGFIDGEPLAHWHHRTSQDGDLGNSVATDARSHRTDNLAIRDRYVREATDGPQGAHELGLMLVSAEYFHRLDTELAELRRVLDDHSLSLDELHASTSRIRDSMDAAHAGLGKMLVTVEETQHELRGHVARTQETARLLAERSLSERIGREVSGLLRAAGQAVRRLRR